MSLILDALRKSERTRQQSLASRVSAGDTPPLRTRIAVPWATLIALLLIVNAIVLGIIFWRSHTATDTAIPSPTASAPTVSVASTPVPIYRPAVRPLAAEAAAAGTATIPSASSIVGAAKQSALSTASVPAANAIAPRTAADKPASADVIVLNPDNAPPLDTLPLAFQQSLPALNLDVHSYSTNPAERFVIINMQRYQVGDTLKEGPKVIQIVPNGVVLEYRGQEFLLPRP